MTEKTIPTLKTVRLIIRPFNLDDANEVQRQAGHPDVAAGTGTEWAMTLADSGKLIGCIGLMGISKTHQRADMVVYGILKDSYRA